MLRLGVIELSMSPYNSPLVLVKKADKLFQACIDFCHINNVLLGDGKRFPRTHVMFEVVLNKTYFSKLDLMKRYWQVSLEGSRRPKRPSLASRDITNSYSGDLE